MSAPLDRRSFLLLAAGVAVAACSRSSARPTVSGVEVVAGEGTPFTSVVMVGDSITEGSRDMLLKALALAGFTDVRIEGKASRRIEVGNGKGTAPLSGIGTLLSLLAEGADPSVWVIELGTNDVGSYAGADEYGALIDKVLHLLRPDAPVVWVNVYRPDQLDATKVFNLVLAQRIADRGNAVVADWYSAASAPDQTILRNDQLHPNENGQYALALLVVDAIGKL